MIVNLRQILVLLFCFFSLYNCNVYEDMKLKKQGCNYNIDIIIFCQGFLEKVKDNKTPKDYEIEPCVYILNKREEC